MADRGPQNCHKRANHRLKCLAVEQTASKPATSLLSAFQQAVRDGETLSHEVDKFFHNLRIVITGTAMALGIPFQISNSVRGMGRHSRDVNRPSFASIFALSSGGRRESRVRAAPAVSRANTDRRTHTSIQVQRRQSGLPCAVVYGLLRALPGERAFLPPSLRGCCHPRNLTPASRRQDHTTSPSA